MTNDKQRERLVELLQTGDETRRNPLRWCDDEIVESLADYLLANGAIVPLVKVGDKVYIVAEVSRKIIECTVIGAWICEGNCTVVTDCGTIYNLSYGETVFLTKEEAEEALKAERKRVKIVINDIPPSNNQYMGNSHNFNIYREEKQRWHWLIKSALKEKPKKPIEKAIVNIHYYFKTNHRRDPDNYSGKMLLDPLVREGILIDDSFKVVTLVLSASHDKKNPRTEIEIRSVGNDEETGNGKDTKAK